MRPILESTLFMTMPFWGGERNMSVAAVSPEQARRRAIARARQFCCEISASADARRRVDGARAATRGAARRQAQSPLDFRLLS
jgi:hypothetical protein